jgi:hypothetical protein
MSDLTTSTMPAVDERTMPIDAEHAGIRLAVPVLTVFGFVIGYFASSWLLQNADQDIPVGCIGVAVGIVLGILAAVLTDRYLKRIWPSGRSLTVNPDGLFLRDQRKKQDAETRITWDQRVNLLAWKFTIQRGSARVPKGWVMLGLKLLQDEAQLVLYTFMPAKEASALPTYDRFVPLASRAQIDKGELSLREAGEQRRLLKAEDERWRDGAEVRREDFVPLLELINRNIGSVQA